jgi:hypothetical protein
MDPHMNPEVDPHLDPHLDDGHLQAYLDDELGQAATRSARDHLSRCPACRTRLEELEGIGAAVAARLTVLDRPLSMEVARSRWDHRRRAAERTSPLHSSTHPARPSATTPVMRPAWRPALSAAAGALLLVTAGVAAALPGSPIRSWIEGREGVSEGAPAASALPVAETTGVFASLRDGAMSIQLHGLPPGAWVELRRVEGDRVGAFAPAGSSFESGPGHLGVRVESSGADDSSAAVRLELPVAAREARVQSGDAVLLRVTPDGLWFPPQVTVDSTSGVIRVRVPPLPNGAGE